MRVAVFVFGLLAACRSGTPDSPEREAPRARLPSPSSGVPTSTAPATALPAAAPVDPPLAAGAGPTRCALSVGPMALPRRSPVALAVEGDHVEAVLNEDGRPRIVRSPAAPGSVGSPSDGADAPAMAGSAVPCAVAGASVFCMDRTGAVHRTARDGGADRVVASARSTSRIAAAAFGAHTAVGYLASRQTSEGWVSEAWLAVDDDPPRRVSEDGSGATAIALAPRSNGLLVVTVDARAALTAMHARPVRYDASLALDEDSVVFVGGPGDRRTRAAVSVPPAGPGWALLPIAKDVGAFGLAAVRLDDPPRVDEPVAWSMYPNGLDPAPVAAAVRLGQAASAPVPWVALVRPRGAEPSSPRALEIGRIDPGGGFIALEAVPTHGNPTDVSLAVDPLGAVWIAWVDSGGAWWERWICASGEADPPRASKRR